MQCPKCGSLFSDKLVRCPACGTAVFDPANDIEGETFIYTCPTRGSIKLQCVGETETQLLFVDAKGRKWSCDKSCLGNDLIPYKIETSSPDEKSFKIRRLFNRIKRNTSALQKVGIIAVAGAFVFGTFGAMHMMNSVSVTQSIETLECGTEYSVSDLAEGNNDEVELTIEGQNNEIKLDEPGTIELTITGNRGEKQATETFTYEVVDTIAPTFRYKDLGKVKPGDKKKDIINALTGVKLSDNSSEKITKSDIEIRGDYDTDIPGKYDITLVVSDASGNSVSKDDTLTVDDGSISWKKSKSHIGEYAIIRGPLVDISYRPDVNGSPTFINIGEGYPSPDRFQAIIWGNSLYGAMEDRIQELYDFSREDYGEIIEIKGNVTNYGGVAQIFVDSPGQLVFPTNW